MLFYSCCRYMYIYLVAVIISFKDSVYCFRLTAFVLQYLAQARPWIDIDDKELTISSDWLKNIQATDGCFPTIGALHNKAMKGGVTIPVNQLPVTKSKRKQLKNCLRFDFITGSWFASWSSRCYKGFWMCIRIIGWCERFLLISSHIVYVC